jgi:hypothetical protein
MDRILTATGTQYITAENAHKTMHAKKQNTKKGA